MVETLTFNFYTLVLIFAALQGVILTFLVLSSKKYQKRSNLALSFGLVATSLIILQNSFEIIGLTNYWPTIVYLPMRLTFLLCASIYFFVQFLIKPNYKFQKLDYLICTPVVLQFLTGFGWLISYLISSSTGYFNLDVFLVAKQIEEGSSIFFAIILFLLALKKIWVYQRELLANYTNIENQDLTWLKYFMFCIIGIWFAWFFYFFGHVTQSFNFVMYPVWIGMACLVYWLGYFMYLRRDIFEIAVFDQGGKVVIPKLSERTDKYFQKLLDLMDSEKLYLNPELNMSILAEKMELSNGYLSQIINQKDGKNFFDFVNLYRVEEVKRCLADPKYDHYSILGIGLEAGFKSKSTFNSVFKKLTGITPTAYKKTLN